jgi:hypothetical protein
MSDLYTSIQVSRDRIVRLQEHLEFEKEKLAKMLERTSAFGGDELRMGCNEIHLKALEGVIEKKRSQIEQNRYSKSIPLARFYDMEKLEMLEPIFNMLKSIEERLEALECK